MSTQPEWFSHEDTVGALKQVSVATITTQLFKRGLKNRFLHGVHPLRDYGENMVGPARTLRYVPMREDIDTLDTLGARDNVQRVVIEDMNRGDILVIDGLGMSESGSLGNILALRLQVRGAGGMVTDGAYRDTPSIRKLDIKAYASGQNANTNLTKYHPVDYDVTIGCGGVLVEVGDAIVGNAEGVVVIPAYLAKEVARDSLVQERREDFIYGLVGEGASVFDVYPMNADTKARYEAELVRNK